MLLRYSEAELARVSDPDQMFYGESLATSVTGLSRIEPRWKLMQTVVANR